jgi:hypothetical protein
MEKTPTPPIGIVEAAPPPPAPPKKPGFWSSVWDGLGEALGEYLFGGRR